MEMPASSNAAPMMKPRAEPRGVVDHHCGNSLSQLEGRGDSIKSNRHGWSTRTQPHDVGYPEIHRPHRDIVPVVGADNSPRITRAAPADHRATRRWSAGRTHGPIPCCPCCLWLARLNLTHYAVVINGRQPVELRYNTALNALHQKDSAIQMNTTIGKGITITGSIHAARPSRSRERSTATCSRRITTSPSSWARASTAPSSRRASRFAADRRAADRARSRACARQSAAVRADVAAPKLTLEEGATFNGLVEPAKTDAAMIVAALPQQRTPTAQTRLPIRARGRVPAHTFTKSLQTSHSARRARLSWPPHLTAAQSRQVAWMSPQPPCRHACVH